MNYKSRLKLGEQRKILDVNIINVFANLSVHQKFSLIREKIVTILLHLRMWELSM